MTDTSYLATIPLADISPDPTQPRKLPTLAELTEQVANGDAHAQALWAGLWELAMSIQEAGLLQPLTVYPAETAGQYVLFDGQRRWLALNLLAQQGLRAGSALCQVRARPATDDDTLLGQLHINLQRADFNVFEMARSLQHVYASLKAHGGLVRMARPEGGIETVELAPDALDDEIWRAVEAKVGIGRSRRYQIQAVLKLPERVQEIAEQAALPESQLRYLAPLPKEQLQLTLVQEMAGRSMSNAEIKARIQELVRSAATTPAGPMPKPNQIRSAIKPLRQLVRAVGDVPSVPGAISSKDPRTVTGYRKLLPELKTAVRELEDLVAQLSFLEET